MTETTSFKKVEIIQIDLIHILNPRERRQSSFQKVVDSIEKVGLKKPIKVSLSTSAQGGYDKPYTLICGQGRLEAFKALGATHIPAIVVELSEEDCFLQSLVENLARRRHSSFELMRGIQTLVERGYSVSEISKKIGVDRGYVKGIAHLITEGEERLVSAVEQGLIPLTVAIEISSTSHANAQIALQEAYERKELRGHKLQTAIKVLNNRQRYGPRASRTNKYERKKQSSAASMVRAYKRETERQRILVQRADLTENRLLIIKSALDVLLSDEHFTTLLRAERLNTIPTQVAEMLGQNEVQ